MVQDRPMAAQLIKPRRFGDERGWFCETYNQERYGALGITCTFVQDNHALSIAPWVLRGLHFQAPPKAQAKLVRCVRGAIWDVAVDIRRGSPTYAQWVAAELNAENGWQLFIPAGFAHGYITLEPSTEVEYKVSALYAPGSEGGVIWNDPTIALPWPTRRAEPILSEKDLRLPVLNDFVSPFEYDGEPLAPLAL